jgi:hypothetical protein
VTQLDEKLRAVVEDAAPTVSEVDVDVALIAKLSSPG